METLVETWKPALEGGSVTKKFGFVVSKGLVLIRHSVSLYLTLQSEILVNYCPLVFISLLCLRFLSLTCLYSKL